MIDIHCHILPGIDDGARDVRMSIEMAQQFAADGVSHVVCTPHIMPGVWNNTGGGIRRAVEDLQEVLVREGIDVTLLAGADNHITFDFVAGLRSGHLLTLGDSRYVLVEPPHNHAPPRMSHVFLDILDAGYVPVLTHPERLAWTLQEYNLLERLAASGTLMQITAGSLAGRFGAHIQSVARRMLVDGLVHVIATDAHDPVRRPPLLSEGWMIARDLVGAAEAEKMVLALPFAMLTDAEIAPAAADQRPDDGGDTDQGGRKGWLRRHIRGFGG